MDKSGVGFDVDDKLHVLAGELLFGLIGQLMRTFDAPVAWYQQIGLGEGLGCCSTGTQISKLYLRPANVCQTEVDLRDPLRRQSVIHQAVNGFM